MRPIRPIAWLILLIAGSLLAWQWAHKRAAPAAPESLGQLDRAGQVDSQLQRPASHRVESRLINPAGTPETIAPDATSAAAPTVPPAPAPAAAVPETPESSSLPAATVLENMRTSIRQYASAFGENPVGTNPEITSALQGENPKHINFLKADGNRVNANGELVDVWGTPYFFHQISGHEMEIRSAGPDRVMYTGDDLVVR